MTEGSYQIVFRGRLVPGADEADVKARLARLFKIEPTRVEALFGGGRKVLKQGLDREAANRYRAVLRDAGARVSVVSAETRSAVSEDYQPESKPSDAPRTRAVFTVDDPAKPEEPAPSAGPTQRAVFQVDDPDPVVAPAPAETPAEIPSEAPAASADVKDVKETPESAPVDEDELLAPPGAQLAEPVSVTAPDISVEGLDLAAVGAIVDESERPPAIEMDLGGLSASDDFERLDERPLPPPPEIEVFDLDLADPEAVVDTSERPAPPQIDVDGLSLSDDYDALDEQPRAAPAQIDTTHLSLEEDPT